MLEVKNLVKKFGEKTAVSGVSISVKKGEIYSIIGPNGSGKTTIIKVIAGLLRANSGSVFMDGKDVSANPLETKAAIGYIPDEPAAWSGMTGEEFLHFVGAAYGVAPKVRAERIQELLKGFNISGIEKDYFENYSRGNKQKFSIMSAFLHEPKLLLVDEPIVGLDPESAEAAKKMFREFAGKGGAVFLATHTLPVAEKISDNIGVLKEGKLLASGAMSVLRGLAGLGNEAELDEVYSAVTRRK